MKDTLKWKKSGGTSRSESNPKCICTKQRSFKMHEIKLIELLVEVEKSTTIIGKFNSPFLTIDRIIRHKRCMNTRTPATNRTWTIQQPKKDDKTGFNMSAENKIKQTPHSICGKMLSVIQSTDEYLYYYSLSIFLHASADCHEDRTLMSIFSPPCLFFTVKRSLLDLKWWVMQS